MPAGSSFLKKSMLIITACTSSLHEQPPHLTNRIPRIDLSMLFALSCYAVEFTKYTGIMADKRNVFLTGAGIIAFVAGCLGVAAATAIFQGAWFYPEPGWAATLPEEGMRWAGVEEVQEVFERLSREHMPAVVQLQLIQRDDRPFGPDQLEDFFLPEEFRVRSGGKAEEQSIGSGIIISEDGYIVTARHLLKQIDEVHAIFFDGTRLRASLVGSDALTDIAVLKVEAEGLPALPLSGDVSVRNGQWVMVIGSPLSSMFKNTATLGVISSHSTKIDSLEGSLYTDAAMNPGNSGGPLINAQGQVVGMAIAPYSLTDGFTGVSRAIPASVVAHVSEQLIQKGQVGRAHLGVQYGPISAAVAPEGAARIIRVEPGSAAEEAGIRAGDVVLAVDGTSLKNHLELSERIAGGEPGDVVLLKIQRGNSAIDMNVRLQDALEIKPVVTDDEDPQKKLMKEMGFTVEDITPELVKDLKIPVTEGVVVLYVNPSSKAYRESDLRGGMVIVEMADQKIANQLDFMRVYNEIPSEVTFLVMVHQPQTPGALLTALSKP